MKLKTLRADPAGNITMFVSDDVALERRGEIAAKIMAIDALKIEQVAFRTGENRIEMSGGEFCGNASRAFGLLLATERGIRGKAELDIEISGCSVPVRVYVDTDSGTASAQMPLPQAVEKKTVGGVCGTLVDMGGIVLFVTEDAPAETAFLERCESAFEKFRSAEACGVLFLEKNGSHMRPLIKVPAAGSLVWEGSCGSGSLACAAARSIGHEGEYTETYIQPAGEIAASVTRRNGEIISASIGGKVTLGREMIIDLNQHSSRIR